MDSRETQLDRSGLETGLERLVSADAALAAALAEVGPPPLWRRPPGFATLVRIVLEQQVSLASARAAFERLVEAADPLTPEAFLALGDRRLRAIGFSRQKALYCRGLAEQLVSGTLDLAELETLPDEAVRRRLTGVRGIGPWTAEIYLLMALGRPDAWPSGDLALARSVAELCGRPTIPGPDELVAVAERWRPWRAVAARLLWHLYLTRRAGPAAVAGGGR